MSDSEQKDRDKTATKNKIPKTDSRGPMSFINFNLGNQKYKINPTKAHNICGRKDSQLSSTPNESTTEAKAKKTK